MQRPEPALPAETLTIGLPHSGKLELRAIRTVAVEQWLNSLVTSKFAGANFLRVAR